MKAQRLTDTDGCSKFGPSLGKASIIHQDKVETGLYHSATTARICEWSHQDVSLDELDIFRLHR